MLGIHVTVPVACFRKGLAREYLETEPLPPPSTCYGFLLSLVGEEDRRRHVGARVGPVLLNQPSRSVVLRTVWRAKEKIYYKAPDGKVYIVPTAPKKRKEFLQWAEEQGWPKPEFHPVPGVGSNARPDFQQLLTQVELLIWLDSSEEITKGPPLEQRVRTALETPEQIHRFGGLSLGESTHLVDEVKPFSPQPNKKGKAFLLQSQGPITLPVWVDHVGSRNTRYVTGILDSHPLVPPDRSRLPQILPPDS